MPGTTAELDATDYVHALVDAGAISTAIADRLDNNGYETIADLLIADQAELEDVPYVGGQRASEILDAVDALMSAPAPRDVDLEATESVVSHHEQQDADEPDPLVELREQVLEVGLGERVSLTFTDRRPLQRRYVSEVTEPVEWECPLGENYETRRVTITDGSKSYDLVATGTGVWLFGEYADESGRLWEVESVAVVGRVSTAKYAQLKGQQEEAATQTPEGDDTWRKYQRGETA